MEVSSRENGSSGDGALDDIDGDGASGTEVSDPQRTKSAIEHYQRKLNKTMELIKAEQAAKEGNWSESRLKWCEIELEKKLKLEYAIKGNNSCRAMQPCE